jgi:lysophospholipase L1-like esterase
VALCSAATLFTAACSAPAARVAVSSPAAPASTAGSPETSGEAKAPLSLVVIGDSIPYNSSDDCPECTGFVAQYANALAKATGREVTTHNVSKHTGLTLPTLVEELPALEGDVRGADALIVAIAHNSIPLNADAPCGSRFNEATSTLEDWSKVNKACADEGTRRNRPLFDELYSTVATWRKGQPTLLLTINKYNDWAGWPNAHLTPQQAARTVMMHDAWNAMLCDSATRSGFTCADIYHAFNGADGHTPSGDLLGGDYTHPSQKGNDEILRVLIAEGFAPLE